MLHSLVRSFQTFLAEEDGPTAVEYAVIISLIAGGIFASVIAVGNAAGSRFDSVTAIFGS